MGYADLSSPNHVLASEDDIEYSVYGLAEFCLGQEYVPDSKYKNCSYPSKPLINFSFLSLILSLSFNT